MQMSQEGIDALLKKFEGCKLKAYRCPAGVCTIGYGHTSAAGAPAVTDGMVITQQQCDDILRRGALKFRHIGGRGHRHRLDVAEIKERFADASIGIMDGHGNLAA